MCVYLLKSRLFIYPLSYFCGNIFIFCSNISQKFPVTWTSILFCPFQNMDMIISCGFNHGIVFVPSKSVRYEPFYNVKLTKCSCDRAPCMKQYTKIVKFQKFQHFNPSPSYRTINCIFVWSKPFFIHSSPKHLNVTFLCCNIQYSTSKTLNS